VQGEHLGAVVEIGDRIMAFEVKHTTRPHTDDAAGLVWPRNQMAGRFEHGYVVRNGGDTFPLGERITALSIDAVCGATS
jgi:hypothetical protein